MAQVEVAPDADEKIEQLEEGWPGAEALVYETILLLERHPLIGRSVEDEARERGQRELRELVISRGKNGYVALYRYNEALDLVEVLAVRHQREAGYLYSFEDD